MTCEQQLQDIRTTEYGCRIEVVTRFLVSVIPPLLVWAIFDLNIILIWIAAHIVLQSAYGALLLNTFPAQPRRRYALVMIVYTLCGLVFASLPIHLVTAGESDGLRIVGTAALAGQAMYTLQRRHRDRGIVISDAIQITAIFAALFILLYPSATSFENAWLMGCIMASLYGYCIVALIAGTRQQERLRDTQQRYAAAQKARALNQFVGGVAHDFNNQLTAILGHLELFEVLESPEERQMAIEESRRAARRAALTVQQLLTSSGRTRLASQNVEMAVFLTELRAVLGDVLDPGMTVSCVPAVDGERAYVDADMLETCAIQLCLNAQDATLANGRVRIWVETRTRIPARSLTIQAPPPYTVLFIEDNGPGVPDEALPMLAEPFYTTKNVNESAGLGLSAVAGFARQSCGALVLERAPLGGLRAALVLPSSKPAAKCIDVKTAGTVRKTQDTHAAQHHRADAEKQSAS